MQNVGADRHGALRGCEAARDVIVEAVLDRVDTNSRSARIRPIPAAYAAACPAEPDRFRLDAQGRIAGRVDARGDGGNMLDSHALHLSCSV